MSAVCIVPEFWNLLPEQLIGYDSAYSEDVEEFIQPNLNQSSDWLRLGDELQNNNLVDRVMWYFIINVVLYYKNSHENTFITRNIVYIK